MTISVTNAVYVLEWIFEDLVITDSELNSLYPRMPYLEFCRYIESMFCDYEVTTHRNAHGAWYLKYHFKYEHVQREPATSDYVHPNTGVRKLVKHYHEWRAHQIESLLRYGSFQCEEIKS